MENTLQFYAAHWEELDFEFKKILVCAVLGSKIGEKYNEYNR